ncbi:MAG: class I SAM-dependent methyltransferase [Planctomycetes bacterium]|nr:class I SAM-dependent methyltransferase [Planctomycetota bacterium]
MPPKGSGAVTRSDLFRCYQEGWEHEWLNRVDADLWPSDAGYRAILEAILDLLGPLSGERLRLLDVGCGVGIYTIHYLRRFPAARAVGVDLSLPQLRTAADLSRRYGMGDRARFLQGDAESLGVRGPYDLVVCSEVIEHLLDPARALCGLRAVCSPVARVILTVPQIYGDAGAEGTFYRFQGSDGAWIETQNAACVPADGTVFRYVHRQFDLASLSNLVEGSGFRIRRVRGVRFKVPLRLVGGFRGGAAFARRARNAAARFVNACAVVLPERMLHGCTGLRFAETLVVECVPAGSVAAERA